MNSRLVCAAAFALAAMAAPAAGWHGFEDANHVCGPKVDPAALKGKVVLVDEWGVNCGPCLQLLPQIQKLHSLWSAQGLVVIGSHRQGFDRGRIESVCRNAGVRYSVYQHAGMSGEPSNGGGLPFMYVVSPSGAIAYHGRSGREATAAIVDLLSSMPARGARSLTGDVELVHFKPLGRQLVFGKNAESRLSSLKSEAKRGGTPRAKEAGEIVAAVERARTEIAGEIKAGADSTPGKALRDLEKYMATFPSMRGEMRGLHSKLKSNREVAALAAFGERVEGVKTRMESARNASQRRSAAAEAANLARQSARLQASSDAAVASEAKSLAAELEDLSAQARSADEADRSQKNQKKKNEPSRAPSSGGMRR